MQAFRKHINESFFNPLLHFIPLLLFLLIDDNFGSSIALVSVYFVVVAILVYGYILYANIYKYLGVSYLVSSLIFALIIFFPENLVIYSLKPVFSEIITLSSLILILLLRKRITEFISAVTPKHVAMTNNIDEHFRIVWMLTGILFSYTLIYIIYTQLFSPTTYSLKYLSQVYWGVLFFVMFYEFIRVNLIRIRLFKEEWWPIVNEKGLIIGSIQGQESLSGDEKFRHPIVRGILINDSKVFLQKTSSKDPINPNLWDVALSNHVRMNETVEQCIYRTSFENYGMKDIKPILLSKYTQDTANENQYIYLFLICNLKVVDINPDKIDCVKWWTLHQIEDNINSGIFTQSFVKELEILKRSGLIENGSYQCNCHLKDVVYQGINKSKN
jgi:isopentenyldiphosphate isomerase